MKMEIGDKLLNNLFSFTKILGGLMAEMINSVDSVTPKVHIGVLHILKIHGPMPISRIGEKMDIAKPNMTQIIDSLSIKGWVKRNSSAQDRRIINVELTGEGKEYIESVMNRIYEEMMQRFSVLSEEEREKVIGSLDYLIGISKDIMNKK